LTVRGGAELTLPGLPQSLAIESLGRKRIEKRLQRGRVGGIIEGVRKPKRKSWFSIVFRGSTANAQPLPDLIDRLLLAEIIHLVDTPVVAIESQSRPFLNVHVDDQVIPLR
jgi:hypothetical protein